MAHRFRIPNPWFATCVAWGTASNSTIISCARLRSISIGSRCDTGNPSDGLLNTTQCATYTKCQAAWSATSSPNWHSLAYKTDSSRSWRKFPPFEPCAGRLAGLSLPLGPGVRVDTHCYEGYTVPPFYDSLLAKIIVHGETRELALARSRRALRECTVAGVKTTLPLYRELLEDNAFLESRTNTQWIAERLDSRAETR